MEWFAVSSTYYLDPKFDGITSTVERMFLRLMALSRQADLKGILPTNPHVSVGIPSGKRSVSELKSRGILSEMDDGKLYFPAWDKWNGIGDELEERRESDRERKRRERAKKAEMSRDNPDMSRGTGQDKTEQDISTYVEGSSHVPAAGEETTPHCPDHPGGTDKPCRACGAHRARHEDEVAERARELAEQRSTVARHNATLRARAIAACTLCDTDGYRDRTVCDHTDRTATAAAGAQRVRDALAAAKGRAQEAAS